MLVVAGDGPLRAELEALAGHIGSTTVGAGLEEVLLIGRRRDAATGELVKTEVRVSFSPTGRADLHIGEPIEDTVEPIDGYRQKVLRAASRIGCRTWLGQAWRCRRQGNS